MQEINIKLYIEKNKFKYTYEVRPRNLLIFLIIELVQVIKGKLRKSAITPEYYLYTSIKEDLTRKIEFKYKDGLINEVEVEPEYDKSNPTYVSRDKIENQ